MRIAIVTLYTPDLLTPGFISKRLPNLRNYAKKHGYYLKEFKKSLDKTRDPQWSKIKAVFNVLKTGEFDWVFWCDADTLFLDKERKLESFIDPNFNFIFCSDLSSTLWVNTGAFFVKSTSYSLRFLKKIYYGKNYYVREKTEFDHEQGSLRELLYENRREEKVKIVETNDSNERFQHFWFMNDPQALFERGNNYFSKEKLNLNLTYSPGDFLVHFAGCDNKDILYRKFTSLKNENIL